MAVIVICLILTVPWVDLQYVIVAFPGHTHLPPDSGVIKHFSYLTQLSMEFQLLLKAKIPTYKDVSCFKSLIC